MEEKTPAVTGPTYSKSSKTSKVMVTPTKPFTGSIEVSGFKGIYAHAVTVLVVSAHGVEQLSFVPPVGDNVAGQRVNSMIVAETANMKYLEQRKVDPSRKQIDPVRSRAIRAALMEEEKFFSQAGEDQPLLYKGIDFRKVLEEQSKIARATFRAAHPPDEYTKADLAKVKAQRRRLKPAVALPPAALEAELRSKCPEACEARDAYRRFASSTQGKAVADAAAVIPPYSPAFGPRNDGRQVLSNIIQQKPDLLAHDAIMMALTEPVVPAAAGDGGE